MGVNDLLFMKFGQRAHMEALYHRGHVFMRTLRYFQAVEDGQVRGDSYDGLSYLYQPEEIVITVGPLPRQALSQFTEEQINHLNSDGSMDIRHPDLAAPVLVRYNAHQDLHVFCLTDATSWIPGPSEICRFSDFGDCVVVIHDIPRFASLFTAAATERRCRGLGRLVQYADPSQHNGSWGPFRKRFEYNWQREFRFCLASTGCDTLQLELGALYKVADLCDAAEVLRRLSSRRAS